MAENDVLFKVKNITLRLGGNLILENLNFDVIDRVRPGVVTGQIVALLGPSGVGKTRLLRIMAGLDEADHGDVYDAKDIPLEAGQVGVVFQNYILLRHRTVLGNLVVAGVMNGMKRDVARDKAAQLLARFGLGERAGFYPMQLSGGQRQRVAIAQQLVHQKQLLLMDEPFSGLDPAALDDVVKLLVQVRDMDELNTLFIVTHDIRTALKVADTALMLGRDRTPDGKITSGAHIKEKIDMVALGLAYRDDLDTDPKFLELERRIKSEFRDL
ncbi:MAG TPA: ATP-binding cassette domain-containing protein [Kofleriaceae bacterium]|jgi:polar amino acid transport system ATP-binding protein/sulfate transport system ATP-binding protein